LPVAHSEDLLLLRPHTQRTNTQALTVTFSDLLKLDPKEMGGKRAIEMIPNPKSRKEAPREQVY
jgi:hypothetical protein